MTLVSSLSRSLGEGERPQKSWRILDSTRVTGGRDVRPTNLLEREFLHFARRGFQIMGDVGAVPDRMARDAVELNEA